MKTKILIALLSITLLSCKKETQNACKCNNPIENVSWMKELKGSMTQCACEMSIIQGTYNQQTVFFIAGTDPLCNGIDTPVLFDCNGNIVRSFNTCDYLDFYKLVTRNKVLFRCKPGE